MKMHFFLKRGDIDVQVGEVHEEPLQSSADEDADVVDESSPRTGFFLIPTTAESNPFDEVDGALPESCQDDAIQEQPEEEPSKEQASSMGMMSVFTAAASPQSSDTSAQKNGEEPRKTSLGLSTTKHVKLVELMAQMLADDGVRS